MGQETCTFTCVSTREVIRFITFFHDVRASNTVFVFCITLGISTTSEHSFYGLKGISPFSSHGILELLWEL